MMWSVMAGGSDKAISLGVRYVVGRAYLCRIQQSADSERPAHNIAEDGRKPGTCTERN